MARKSQKRTVVSPPAVTSAWAANPTAGMSSVGRFTGPAARLAGAGAAGGAGGGIVGRGRAIVVFKRGTLAGTGVVRALPGRGSRGGVTRGGRTFADRGKRPCSVSRAVSAPVYGSQKRTVRSQPAETSVLPSGANARPVTSAWWPVSVCTASPLFAFQMRIVWSHPPVASRSPSGANATAEQTRA